MCIIRFQTIQKFICIFSRTIIKGKCNSWFMCIWIICTVIIEVIIVKSNAYPSCLNVTILIKIIGGTIYFLHTSGKISAICILIPFTIFIFIPSNRHLRCLCQIILEWISCR